MKVRTTVNEHKLSRSDSVHLTESSRKTASRRVKVQKFRYLSREHPQGYGAERSELKAKTNWSLETTTLYFEVASCQTGRSVSTRITRRVRATENRDCRLAIILLSENAEHQVRFEKTKILASVHVYQRCWRSHRNIENISLITNVRMALNYLKTWTPQVKIAFVEEGHVATRQYPGSGEVRNPHPTSSLGYNLRSTNFESL